MWHRLSWTHFVRGLGVALLVNQLAGAITVPNPDATWLAALGMIGFASAVDRDKASRTEERS